MIQRCSRLRKEVSIITGVEVVENGRQTRDGDRTLGGPNYVIPSSLPTPALLVALLVPAYGLHGHSAWTVLIVVTTPHNDVDMLE
jgi:hypothetical protein